MTLKTPIGCELDCALHTNCASFAAGFVAGFDQAVELEAGPEADREPVSLVKLALASIVGSWIAARFIVDEGPEEDWRDLAL